MKRHVKRREMLAICAMLVLPALANAQAAHARASLTTPGCWEFSRPLGSSATGNVEGQSAEWRVLAFRAGGALTIPLLQPERSRGMWERRSGWRAEGDSIRARLFTGLVGWDVTLREQMGLGDSAVVRIGRADYLSDVVVNGRAYTTSYPVSARPVACPDGFDVQAIVRPGWNPDATPAYFDSQVDTKAIITADSPRPTLAANERRAGVRDSVLAQFIVDLHGRPDSATLKILHTTDSLASRAVARAAPLMRYRPALVKGKPVAQLVQQRFNFD